MLGIIGGSGFYQAGFLHHKVEQSGCSQYGEASDQLVFGQLGQAGNTADNSKTENIPLDACFLARHGRHHSIPPHRINYRANIDVMAAAGVTRIVAVNAVGSCKPGLGVGSLVMPDQLIDYTYGREHSFFDELQSFDQHIDFTLPFDSDLSTEVRSASKSLGLDVVQGGTYGCTQGPRLETAAEIRRMVNDGCDLVGMTAMPEAALAREKNIPYVTICVVVNMAAGIEGEEIDIDGISSTLDEAMGKVRDLIIGLR